MGTIFLFLFAIGVLYFAFVYWPELQRARAQEEEERVRQHLARSHGTARFADYAEVFERPEAAREPEYQAGKGRVYAGVLESGADNSYVPLMWNTDQHVLLVAAAGAGKGRDVIIPNLLLYPGPAFVLDPKGENARVTGRCRERYGEVHYLDPFGVTGKPASRFNPLARMTPQNAASESARLASAIVMREGGESAHWTEATQQLLTGMIAHVATHPVHRAHADLPLVRRLLMRALDATLEEMRDNQEADGVVASTAAWMLGIEDRERSGIVSTAVVQTRFLDNPNIRASLSAAGEGKLLDLAQFHAAESGSLTVYMSLPAPEFRAFNRWLRLVTVSALDELTQRQRQLKHPVWFMLDELATLGHFEPVQQAIGLARGYGVQIWSIFQDMGQMRDIYKERTSTFMSNSGVKMFFAIEDNEGAKYISDLCGMSTIDSRTTNTNPQGETGTSWGVIGRSLLTPDEVRRELQGRKMLVLLPGLQPVPSWRVPYYEWKFFDGAWDAPDASHAAA